MFCVALNIKAPEIPYLGGDALMCIVPCLLFLFSADSPVETC